MTAPCKICMVRSCSMQAVLQSFRTGVDVMTMMKERVRQFIEEENMICPGDTVVTGVSGGADSLCLFLLLREIAEEMHFDIHVVHVHHGLRETAGDDLAFVKKLCGQAGVPCSIERVDAAGCARRWGVGVEEAARTLRYQAFRRVCGRLAQQRETGKGFRIAVAHHREDQAETVLFHLCRGTDLRGARGMQPVNGDIIRPLLCESRASIESYLTERGFSWQEDETNTDTSYTRNYLRREIIPRLESGVHTGAAKRIAQFAAGCREAEEYLTRVTERALEHCRSACSVQDRIFLPQDCRGLFFLDIEALQGEDSYLQGRILFRCLADSSETGRDIGTVHVDALRALCRKKTDGMLSMPAGVRVIRSAGKLFFCREAAGTAGPLEAAGIYPLSAAEYTCRLLDFDGCMSSIPENKYTKWFDYDKIGMFPVFRTRQPGDCMSLFINVEKQRGSGNPEDVSAGGRDRTCMAEGGDNACMTGDRENVCMTGDRENVCTTGGRDRPCKTGDRTRVTKKLARIMLDGKIPAGVRDRLVLPFFGKEALWIPGIRMGDSCKVTPETVRILEIHWNSAAFS